MEFLNLDLLDIKTNLRMKTRIIFCSLLFNFTLLCSLYSQECIYSFTTDLHNQIFNLKKQEQKSINQFMKVGYKIHPEYKLQERNVISIPIYCLFYNKKLHSQNSVKEVKNILCYIDTKKIYINEVYFYKDSVFCGSANVVYSNYPNQPFGKCASSIDLAEIILKEKPDIVFTLGQTNGYYIFMKNRQFYVYARELGAYTKYIKYGIDNYIDNHLDISGLIIGTDFSPAIYCK
jgi:hypothetical protein